MNDHFLSHHHGNISIKVNELCNTTCSHCTLYGKDKSVLDFKKYKDGLVGIYNILYEEGIRTFDIGIVGGELTLMKEEDLYNTYQDFEKTLIEFLDQKNEEEIKEIVIHVALISNFIFDINPLHKKGETLKKITQESLLRRYSQLRGFKNEIAIHTSYDIGLGRFKSKNILNVWKNNCKLYKEELTLLVTLNKETCEKIDEILEDNFFNTFTEINFQPLVVFENMEHLMPSEELLKTVVNKIKAKKDGRFNIGMDKKPKYFVALNNDGMFSCTYSEDLTHYENKFHIHINEACSAKEEIRQTLKSQLANRIKKTMNKNCLSCEMRENCNYGFEWYLGKFKCPSLIK